MTALIRINDVELTPIEYRGVRVMTLAMMDAVHKRPEGTARRNFNENKSRLIEGEDFHEVTADEIRTQSLGGAFALRTPKGTLLTETGYSMLVKSFTDDLAWDVQRQLVRSYFGKATTTPNYRPAALPDFSDPIASARAWADAKEAEKAQAARAAQLEHEVAALAPAVEALDRIVATEDTFCITDAAKHLQVPPRKLRDFLLREKWMYTRQGKAGYVAYQDRIHSGDLVHKYGQYQDPETGERKTNAQVLVTSKGVTKLAKALNLSGDTQ